MEILINIQLDYKFSIPEFYIIFEFLPFFLRFTRIILDLYFVGGVYDSPEAKLYWSRRFGNLFTNLASIQVWKKKLKYGI